MNNSPSTNGNSPSEWQARASQADSPPPPPRFRFFARQEIIVGARIPRWQRNRAAVVGFILGSVGLVFCAGRFFHLPLLVALFTVFDFPISLVGIIVSAVSCRRPFRKAMARWGLAFSLVAFVLLIPLAVSSRLTRPEAQATNLLLGIVLIVIESVCFVGFGALMIVGALAPWWEWLRVLWRGVTVEGNITDRRTQTTPTRHRTMRISYFIAYEYRYGGERYSHEQRVNRQCYATLDQGMRVAVRCRSYHPQVACLLKLKKSIKEVTGSVLLFLFGTGWLGFSLFIVILTVRTFPWGG